MKQQLTEDDMELFHTSPEEIKTIAADGRFGEFLFFSAHVYVMTVGEYVTYKIEVDEDDIIEAGRLFYHEDAELLDPLVEEVMNMLGCDEDMAEDFISQDFSTNYNADIDAEDSWTIQAITAKAAKTLGYRGVYFQDEQGRCYMIDMLGHEDELVKV
jgi:hypothetical protein